MSHSFAISSPRQSSRKYMGLAGDAFAAQSVDELKARAQSLLDQKIHGLSFSPYIEGQGPGTQLQEQQIRDRLSIIAPSIKWVRSFSCTEGNELIPRVAHDMGLKTLTGVWLDGKLENNEKELANGIETAKAGHVDILAIGNEVLLREDLSPAQLIDYIERARAALPGVQIGYVDAYFLFENHPEVAAVCDVVLANCYPFWEGCPAEHSLLYMKEMYRRAVNAAQGKKVIISETGWPNKGTPDRGAVPSYENALRYFVNTCQWAEDEDIDVFYFSSFDESWKVRDEGDVGAYWGLWDKDGNPKYTP